jgi:hypothetical protein
MMQRKVRARRELHALAYGNNLGNEEEDEQLLTSQSSSDASDDTV